jgi:hypothetical protein
MCFKHMVQPVPQRATPYVVASPRATDAIGCALRGAYVRQPLPDDMLMLVNALNGRSQA